MVNTQEISRTCYCPLRTRTGHFCGASSKFRIHINDGTGEYRYACRTHLPHVLSEFPQDSEPIIYSIEQSGRRIHAILRRVEFDPETRRVRTVFPLIPQTAEEDAPTQQQPEDDVNNNVVNTPLFHFTNPLTNNYGSMYTTPPATPERTPSSHPLPPRPQFPLQRSNAGWYDLNENVGLFRTDLQHGNTSQPSFMDRLNQAWSPTFIPQFNEQHASSPPPPPPPTMTMPYVNYIVKKMIRHRGGVKLNPSSNTCVECSVCLTHDVTPETGGALRCGHTFHNECISKWFMRGKFNCPCCRASADILPLIN